VHVFPFFNVEYEAQSMDFDKELNEAITARKDLETNNEGIVMTMILYKNYL